MAFAYTKRISIGTVTAPGDRAVYTVAPGQTVVLRDLVVNNSPADASFQFYVVTGSGNGVVWLSAGSSSSWQHLSLRQAMHEGDVLHVQNSGSILQWMVTAYELTSG